MENEVIRALKTRRSFRAYKPEQITDEELKTVLEAGTWAPTGMGRQDPWIVAVQNPRLREQISRMNAEVWGKDMDPFYGAPTSCSCSPPTRRFGRTASPTERSSSET